MKCKYCGYRFKQNSFEIRDHCFSCKSLRDIIKIYAEVTSNAGLYGKRSEKYWGNKLFEVLNK